MIKLKKILLEFKDLLLELSRDDYTSNYAGPTAKEYSINSSFRGINSDTGTITFKVWDSKGSNLQHTVKIQMIEFNALKNDSERIEDTLKTVLNAGDLKVFCTCKSFRYNGFAYITHVYDSNIQAMTIRPVVRNPKEEGLVCKHIHGLLRKIDKYIPTIAKRFKI